MTAARALAPAGLALLSCALVVATPPAAAQCSMCKATLESSAEAVGAQFNRAILVMLAGPYVVVGTFGFLFFRERVRSGARRLLARLRPRAGSDPSR